MDDDTTTLWVTRQAEDSDRKDKDTSDENTAFLKKTRENPFFQLQGRGNPTTIFTKSRGSA